MDAPGDPRPNLASDAEREQAVGPGGTLYVRSRAPRPTGLRALLAGD